MTVVNHPVVDIINYGLTINNELCLRMIKDDTKMSFKAFNKQWRRQELETTHIIRHIFKQPLP